MSTKTEIKKLTEEIENVKNMVNRLIIDIDDPNYAIYVKSDWGQSNEYFDNNMHKKKPINKTAVNHELERLYTIKKREFDKKAENPYAHYEIPEYDMLWSIPQAEEKQIYAKDPNYLVYRKSFSYGPTDEFKPFNKAAKEHEEKYNPVAILLRKEMEINESE